MNVNLPIGRRLEMSRPAKISEFGQEEISLAFVGPAAAPCPDPSLARPNPLCIRSYFLIRMIAPWSVSGMEKPLGEPTPLQAIRRLHAIRFPVVQTEGRPRAHWTRRRPCAELTQSALRQIRGPVR